MTLAEACILYKEVNGHHFAVAVFPSATDAKIYAAKYYKNDGSMLIQPIPFNPQREVSFYTNSYPWSIK